jgi:hypothetical protein
MVAGAPPASMACIGMHYSASRVTARASDAESGWQARIRRGGEDDEQGLL